MKARCWPLNHDRPVQLRLSAPRGPVLFLTGVAGSSSLGEPESSFKGEMKFVGIEKGKKKQGERPGAWPVVWPRGGCVRVNAGASP